MLSEIKVSFSNIVSHSQSQVSPWKIHLGYDLFIKKLTELKLINLVNGNDRIRTFQNSPPFKKKKKMAVLSKSSKYSFPKL